jgi:hypothetical protein
LSVRFLVVDDSRAERINGKSDGTKCEGLGEGEKEGEAGPEADVREEWSSETAVLTKSGSRETAARTAVLAAWKKAKPAATAASSRRPRAPISNPTDTAHSTSVAAKNTLASPPARWGGGMGGGRRVSAVLVVATGEPHFSTRYSSRSRPLEYI